MWRIVAFGVLVGVIAVVAGTARMARSDAASPELMTDTSFPLPAPAADPVAPASPGARPPRELFTPYDTGPPEATWRYEDLTAAEKETADLGRDVSGWSASQDAMVAAVREQGRIEAAKIAQRQLGLGQLGDTGVVP